MSNGQSIEADDNGLLREFDPVANGLSPNFRLTNFTDLKG